MIQRNKIQYSPEIEVDLQALGKDLLPRRFGTLGKIWVAVLVLSSLLSLILYIGQLRKGLIITDLRDLHPGAFTFQILCFSWLSAWSDP